MTVLDLLLIPDPRGCCAGLTGSDAYIGVSVIHPYPNGEGRDEVDVFWRDTPPGRQQVTLEAFTPLRLTEQITCGCGWSGTVGDP
jgi:hypothetical protein